MTEAIGGHSLSAVGPVLAPDRGEHGNRKFPLDLPNPEVYRFDLVARRWRSVLVTRSHCVRRMPAVLGLSACSLCLVACGGSGASTSTTASTSPTTAAIVKAWLAAQKAFHDAALTSDANSPELTAAMVAPQLDRARTNLATFASRGYRAQGVTHYGTQMVRSRSRSRALVVSCAVDDEIEVAANTGRPVSGVLGRPSDELISSVMRKTSRGWKLADQTIAVGGCVGS
jgi:hypothetical protein